MKNIKPQDHKEEFQLERIALFSDAVFAIAITLLIIEIKVPELHSPSISDKELWNELVHILPKFIGFFVSFVVVGLYWLTHHRIFKYVTSVNQKLLWNNLFFLFPIVIMPFSTAFFSEYYISSLKLPFAVYTLTICLSGFFSFNLWRIIANPKNKVSDKIDKIIVNYNSTRALVIPFIFILTFLFSYITIWSYLIPPFIPFVSKIITKYYFKKYPEVMKTHYN